MSKNKKQQPGKNNDAPKLTMSANNRIAKWIVYAIILALLLGTGLSFFGAAVPLNGA